jgi:hypothetical protein
MRMTFFHKVILTILAGAAMASLIEFYKNFIEGADRAINAGYEHRTGMPAKR